MPPLRQPMIAALHLSGKSERTPESYVRAVHLLARFDHPSPDRMTAPELQHDFRHRTKVAGLVPASLRLCSRGLRFFSHPVLHRDWHTLMLMRPPSTHRRPAVLRVEEGKRLLASATPCHTQGYGPPVSRWGLRLHEALFLPVSALAGQRLQGHGQRGTGAKDRAVSLPAEPLTLLRTSWKTPRHPPWLFPATGRHHPQRPPAPTPRRRSRVQGACRTAPYRAGITTMGAALPPLRPASATPLLAAGVHPRLVQHALGPTPRDTTRRSRHLTPKGQEEADERRNGLMPGLLP